MGFDLERDRPLESRKKQSNAVVCGDFTFEYGWNFGDYLYRVFPEEEIISQTIEASAGQAPYLLDDSSSPR